MGWDGKEAVGWKEEAGFNPVFSVLDFVHYKTERRTKVPTPLITLLSKLAKKQELAPLKNTY